MKARFAAILCIAALCTALCGCSAKNSVRVRVFVPDSETGVSGTLYDGDWDFNGDIVTVDAVLASLGSSGKFTYTFDGSLITIDGLSLVEAPYGNYIRGWTVTVNGETAADGALTKVKKGDSVELVYEFFDISGE